MELIEKLGIAIVEQACSDYLLAARNLKKLEDKRKKVVNIKLIESIDKKMQEQEWMMDEVEDFIRGPLYEVYCELDPETLIDKLKELDGRRTKKSLKDPKKKKRKKV